jgi:hypothetical protein
MVRLSVEVPDGVTIVAQREPDLYSQRNCDQVGMTGADFLRAVANAERDGVPIIRQGQLRLVERTAFLAWLRKRPAPSTEPANDQAAVDNSVTRELDNLTECGPVRPAPKRR